jgi:hypothetical protein
LIQYGRMQRNDEVTWLSSTLHDILAVPVCVKGYIVLYLFCVSGRESKVLQKAIEPFD